MKSHHENLKSLTVLHDGPGLIQHDEQVLHASIHSVLVHAPAGNINADLPLANACVADADKLCKNLAKDVTVLGCLRDNKDQLTEECKAEVFERQALGADDWRADIELFNACEVQYCPSGWNAELGYGGKF